MWWILILMALMSLLFLGAAWAESNRQGNRQEAAPWADANGRTVDEQIAWDKAQQKIWRDLH